MSRSGGAGDEILHWALVAGAWVVASTELLGIVGWIGRPGIVISWLGFGAAVMAWRSRRGPSPRLVPRLPGGVGARAALGGVLLLLVLTLITALVAAPNAWDSLTYHLPRIERWVEQGSLDPWPTSVDRQLWMAPGAEYLMLHLRVLTGGDRLSALPSWLAYLGIILLSGHQARRLAGSTDQVWLAAVAAATVPVAVLHASSTQSDLVTAFWVLCAVLLALDTWFRGAAASGGPAALWMALAVALAVGAKGTAWIALLPWLVLYAWGLVRHGGAKALVLPLGVGTAALLLLNGPLFLRNLDVFADPLGDPVARGSLQLVPLTLSTGLANLSANLSVHLGTPWEVWNSGLAAGIGWLHRDILQVDPAAVFPFFGGFRVPAFSTHESLAGNPVHLVAGLALVLSVGWRSRSIGGSPLWVMCGVGLLAVLLHGILIRWQLYGARLQLPALAWLPAALALGVRRRGMTVGLGVLMVVAALPALVANHLRPLVGPASVLALPRPAVYFAERPALRPGYLAMAGELRRQNCEVVGLIAGYDLPEYLLRAAVREEEHRAAWHYLEPASRSASVAGLAPSGPACAVAVLDPPPGWRFPPVTHGMRVAWHEGDSMLLVAPE